LADKHIKATFKVPN